MSEKIRVDEALPLGNSGEITCVTCHSAHEQVIPNRLRFDEARSARWRAALAGRQPPRTLRQAEALLKAAAPAR